MGFLNFSSVVFLSISIIGGYIFYSIRQVPEVPDIHVKYWGPGIEKPDNKAILPFKINISEEVSFEAMPLCFFLWFFNGKSLCRLKTKYNQNEPDQSLTKPSVYHFKILINELRK